MIYCPCRVYSFFSRRYAYDDSPTVRFLFSTSNIGVVRHFELDAPDGWVVSHYSRFDDTLSPIANDDYAPLHGVMSPFSPPGLLPFSTRYPHFFAVSAKGSTYTDRYFSSNPSDEVVTRYVLISEPDWYFEANGCGYISFVYLRSVSSSSQFYQNEYGGVFIETGYVFFKPFDFFSPSEYPGLPYSPIYVSDIGWKRRPYYLPSYLFPRGMVGVPHPDPTGHIFPYDYNRYFLEDVFLYEYTSALHPFSEQTINLGYRQYPDVPTFYTFPKYLRDSSGYKYKAISGDVSSYDYFVAPSMLTVPNPYYGSTIYTAKGTQFFLVPLFNRFWSESISKGKNSASSRFHINSKVILRNV